MTSQVGTMPESGRIEAPAAVRTLDTCTLGSDEKIRRPSLSALPAKAMFKKPDLARRSLQPKSREKNVL